MTVALPASWGLCRYKEAARAARPEPCGHGPITSHFLTVSSTFRTPKTASVDSPKPKQRSSPEEARGKSPVGMASPVSFGDIVAMAKIAKAVTQAFTRGRKSAPAEFREVENQLLSLSAALSALKDALEGSAQPPSLAGATHEGGGQTVSGMLESCSDTLKHLEKIVEKYSVIAEQREPNTSRMQRWSQELIKNYKKIAWTTEAGSLATLRSQLMIHTNSLDLVLGIIIK